MIPMCRSVCLFVALFCLQLPVWSAITVQPWVPAYAGVDYASGEADSNEPRMQKVFAYRIELQHPAIEMFSTPAGGPYETIGQTTTTFVSAYGVKIGINANFFSPVSVTLLCPSIESITGLFVPTTSPDQPVKTNPGSGSAVSVTVEFGS